MPSSTGNEIGLVITSYSKSKLTAIKNLPHFKWHSSFRGLNSLGVSNTWEILGREQFWIPEILWLRKHRLIFFFFFSIPGWAVVVPRQRSHFCYTQKEPSTLPGISLDLRTDCSVRPEEERELPFSCPALKAYQLSLCPYSLMAQVLPYTTSSSPCRRKNQHYSFFHRFFLGQDVPLFGYICVFIYSHTCLFM